MHRPVIAIIGDARIPRTGLKWRLAESLGRGLADEGFRIVTGGLGDLPEAVASGARRSKRYREGDLLAVLPGFDPAVAGRHSDIAIATGIDQARNLIVANSDAVVAIGGGAGTLSEIAFAWSLKRLIMAYRVKGWSGKLAGTRIDSRQRIDADSQDKIYPVKSAEDVLQCLRLLLPRYRRRHRTTIVRRAGQ